MLSDLACICAELSCGASSMYGLIKYVASHTAWILLQHSGVYVCTQPVIHDGSDSLQRGSSSLVNKGRQQASMHAGAGMTPPAAAESRNACAPTQPAATQVLMPEGIMQDAAEPSIAPTQPATAAQHLVPHEPHHDDLHQQHMVRQAAGSNTMFSTAGGRGLAVKPQHLQAAYALLSSQAGPQPDGPMPGGADGHAVQSGIRPNSELQPPQIPMGFATANGRAFSIDPKQLEHARSLLGSDTASAEASHSPVAAILYIASLPSQAQLPFKADVEGEVVHAVPVAAYIGHHLGATQRYGRDLQCMASRNSCQDKPAFLTTPLLVQANVAATSAGISAPADGVSMQIAAQLLGSDAVPEQAPPPAAEPGGPGTEGPAFTGFATAAGRSMPVDPEAMRRAQQLLASQSQQDQEASQAPAPFCTAGGRSVAVDDKQLQQARQLMADTVPEPEAVPAPTMSHSSSSDRKRAGRHQDRAKSHLAAGRESIAAAAASARHSRLSTPEPQALRRRKSGIGASITPVPRQRAFNSPRTSSKFTPPLQLPLAGRVRYMPSIAMSLAGPCTALADVVRRGTVCSTVFCRVWYSTCLADRMMSCRLLHLLACKDS